mmetsp:Transcript_8490/g.12727  ORF Transcript_8490/g.12727 Transcript_8490/m.12727 type:complete len:511 (-) Transcript_8490:209-1741(-)|eukprot:CAMPEP_0167757888 /NCGR_PEP_ID=MMETSP0110_2-20121227/10171_1 /TAXON_ID=629695 /ORGANISM="Gymnochlora sp., Strain CCMP2014" /LENGTH=510 /DNA_ID=CAMNT_0007644119 /DNA_START=28 /DNA_END=1560 /DNA_ORIENTATION=+
MGKRQHQGDKMYMRASEWKNEFGGKKTKASTRAFKRLPFDCCALSLRPFENPVASPEGIVFDLVNIVPYIKKNKKNPVTGEPLKLKQLKKLKYHKNAEGRYHCPLTHKEFTNHTHIVAIWTSGNVFSYQAIEELNLKPKHFVDLISGEEFKKTDIISIQDPHNFSESRNITSFLHQKKKKEKEEKVLAVKAKKIRTQSSKDDGNDGNAPLSAYSSGYCSGSFTSTAMTPVTQNKQRKMTEDEIREERYKEMKGKSSTKPAYIQMKTTKGNLNLMLYVSKAPRTCHNFLRLCETGYYKGVMFHRLIKRFMIQGGDPTGTGRGGRSAWGKKFKDEIEKSLSHNKRGILSMANSGKDTNGSQFFIIFAPAKHLDGKHSIFGEVVGGLHVLDEMEKVETDTKRDSAFRDRPKEAIRILDTKVFQNPFKEAWVPKQIRRKIEEEKKKAEEIRLTTGKRKWFSAPAPQVKPVSGATIGKYMNFKRIRTPKESDVDGKLASSKMRKKAAWGSVGKYF